MTKLIDCPICGETKPVRDDAKVCSSNCRVKAWRERKKISKDLYAALIYLAERIVEEGKPLFVSPVFDHTWEGEYNADDEKS